jgi:hypothetical protein
MENMYKLSALFLLPVVFCIALQVQATEDTAKTTQFNLDSLLVQSLGGPQARDKLLDGTSFRSAGSADLNGLRGRFQQVFVPPDKLYLELNLGHLRLVQAFDGETAWQIDANGRASRLSGFERRELLKSVYFESMSYIVPDRLEGDYEYKGLTERNGQTYHEVHFYPMFRDTVRALYDTTDGFRRLMISRLDNVPTITEVSDYRTVQGIPVPFRSVAVAPDVPMEVVLQADTVIFNDAIDRRLFVMPGEEPTDSRFPGNTTHVDVPFDYRFGHIRIKAILNGRMSAWFILDSGASANLLHQPLADRLKLPVVGSLPARGIGGYEQVALVKTDSLQIGDMTLYDQVAGTFDLSELSPQRDTATFGGLIGYDFLSRFPVRIDYANRTLRVYNPENFIAPDSGTEIPFDLTMQVPTVTAEVLGTPGQFLVDLGNAFGLVIHPGFINRHNLGPLLSEIETTDQWLGGVGGALRGKTAYIAAFRMGDILISDLRVILPDSGTGLTASEELDGNIGNLVLENFSVLFDYPGHRIIVYPAAEN